MGSEPGGVVDESDVTAGEHRSATGLRLMPRGSVVSTVWSAASSSASEAKYEASIGAPASTMRGPAPRTS